MTDVKTLIDKLIEKTASGAIKWHECDNGYGELEGHKATCEGVEFDLDAEQHRLFINNVSILGVSAEMLNPLRTAVHASTANHAADERQRHIDLAISAASSALSK